MAKARHPLFTHPEEPSAALWRYMDFAKFVSMLEIRGLFFCRADRLGDPFEGSYSRANQTNRPKKWPDIYRDLPPLQSQRFEDEWVANTKWLLQWTLVNCWHMSEHESEAMWKLYGVTGQSLAIRTTFGKLWQSLPEHGCDLGMVKYVDYDTHLISEKDCRAHFMHKRQSFEHEREVRALIQDLPKDTRGHITNANNPEMSGRVVTIDLNLLIDAVYVAPGASHFFRDLVQRVMKKYALHKELVQSRLDESPVY
jgi:hypothetical protein